ncbi:MFS transporter [Raoultibacter phocaeensis]|uniref:MFS transporter n=1 Tax=Raoultibacter phocaeensis TaxID=2479841 RepID=UPI00111BA4AB|nr:MFS transporter [Raoultibacter phocaeensis]
MSERVLQEEAGLGSDAEASVSAASAKPKKLFYGYVLIVVLGFMYFCSSGIVLPTATIVNPLMLEDQSLGMNATILGTGFSLFVLVQGISAPLVGALISRKGARFSMTLGAVVMLAAMLTLIFFVSSPIAYFIVFGIVTSAATMMVGQLAVQSTIGDWFIARRGMAMTAMMVIGASASFVGPPVVNAIIGATGGGWRSGWYLLVALSIVLIPVALLFIKNKPADIGQFPDGAADAGALAGESKNFKVYKNTAQVAFKEVVKSKYFWLISLAATGGFASYTLATSQGVIHFSSLGFDHGLIVAGVAIMGGISLLGKLLLGMVSDRIEPVRLIVVSTVILFVGILAGAAAQNDAMVYAFFLCVGFGLGGVNAVFPTAMANYFGASSFSKNLGTGIMITTVVASTLPIMSGAIFDATGTCSLAFYITAAIVAVCAVCGLLVKIPKNSQR